MNPAPARAASDSGVTESGFASVVTSTSSANPQASRTPPSMRERSGTDRTVGVPPPTNTVLTGRGGRMPAASAISFSAVSAYACWLAPPPSSVAVYVLKSQYPQRTVQNGTCR